MPDSLIPPSRPISSATDLDTFANSTCRGDSWPLAHTWIPFSVSAASSAAVEQVEISATCHKYILVESVPYTPQRCRGWSTCTAFWPKQIQNWHSVDSGLPASSSLLAIMNAQETFFTSSKSISMLWMIDGLMSTSSRSGEMMSCICSMSDTKHLRCSLCKLQETLAVVMHSQQNPPSLHCFPRSL